jgi:hypothetical protein
MGTIYRKFPYYYKENIVGHYGKIQIDIYENNYLQIVIDGFLEDIIQITVSAEYPKSQENNLYNITRNILDKVSKELYYDSFELVIPTVNKRIPFSEMGEYLQTKRIQSEPIDMIVYYKTGIPPHEENWNAPNEESSLYWKPFVAENMKFLDINARDDTFDEEPDIKISIDENGDFDYAEFSQHIWDNYANEDNYKDLKDDYSDEEQ